MKGNFVVTFSELVRDTIMAHGLKWAALYYKKRGLSLMEFVIFAGLPPRGLI